VIEQLAQEFGRRRFAFVDEAELQLAIEAMLLECGQTYAREVVLSPRDRVDFMLGNTALEVKIKGSQPAVLEQLERYANSDQVSAIVLVTSRFQLRAMPPEINGKPVSVIYLPRL